MRLIAMRLKGFQCYRDLQTVNFDPAVTLIAGSNDHYEVRLRRQRDHAHRDRERYHDHDPQRSDLRGLA
jgi:hypothetical protein